MPVVSNYRNPSSVEFAELNTLFTAVVEAIHEIKSLPLISAVPYDDELPRPRVYNALAVEYLADLEKATRLALSKGGQLDAELWNAFCALFAGEQVAQTLKREVITRTARLYESRGLRPNRYFARFRRGSVATEASAA